MKKYITLFIAIIILAGAYAYGHVINKMDEGVVQGYYQQVMPEAASFEAITDRTAKALDADGKPLGYVGVSTNVGYGGPMAVCSVFDLEGNLVDFGLDNIVEHKETPSYLNKINRQGFFRQFEKKTAKDSLMLGSDVDAVSGATLSSRAITNSVRDVGHAIATSELGMTPDKAKIDWSVGIAEIAVALIFVMGLVLSRVKKFGKFRIPLLLLSVVVLGFWLNRSASIAQFSALFLGFFPVPQTNLIWYIVMIGAIVPALLTGKNFYCTYVCPFCGLQEATHLISKVNLPLGKNIKWIRTMRDVILFLVIFLAFLTMNPSVSGVEPFGTIFGLTGESFAWYLLFAVLVISFFFKRFWCTAFCPAGAFLDKIASISRDVRKKLGIGNSAKKAKKGAANHAE